MGSFFLQVAKKSKKRRRIRRSEARDDISIPMDVMTEILTRLPSKSLMRFKCVSKLWSSLICSLYFTNRFLTMVPSQQRLYLIISHLTGGHNPVIVSLSSAATTTTPSSSSFVVNHDLTIPGRGGLILHSLCGFLCYSYWHKPRLYNPSTRQLVTLPAAPTGFPEDSRLYYFGHDPIDNQFKLICSVGRVFRSPTLEIRSEQWVYVLKPGASWRRRRRRRDTADFCPHVPIRGGLSINGVIYYLAWVDHTYTTHAVVSFDVRSEEFKMIKVPSKDDKDEGFGMVSARTSLVEYGGKVTVFDSTHLRYHGVVDLWVLEDAGNKQWSKKTLVVQPSQLHLVNYTYNLDVKGTSQGGKVLLMPHFFHSTSSHILCYDLLSNDIRRIDIKGIPYRWFSEPDVCVDLMFMDQSESIMYLENCSVEREKKCTWRL